MSLDDDFKLSIQNTLYWESDGFFDLGVRQATVARICRPGSVRTDLLLEKVRPLVDLIRFLSGEDCVLRSAYLRSMDRALPETYGGGPIGMQLLTSKQGHQFTGWGEMLFRLSTAGRPRRGVREGMLGTIEVGSAWGDLEGALYESTVKIREGFRVKRGFDEWDGRSQTLAVFGRERRWT